MSSVHLTPKYLTNIINQVIRIGSDDAFVAVNVRANGHVSVDRYFAGPSGTIYATNHVVSDPDALIDWLRTCAFNAIVEVHDYRNAQELSDPWEEVIDNEAVPMNVF